MWIARDKDGTLCMYGEKPVKENDEEWWMPIVTSNFIRLEKDSFPHVKWSDKEPTEVEVTIKLK